MAIADAALVVFVLVVVVVVVVVVVELQHCKSSPKFPSTISTRELPQFQRVCCIHSNLGGGFKYFLFSPLFGEMIQFD